MQGKVVISHTSSRNLASMLCVTVKVQREGRMQGKVVISHTSSRHLASMLCVTVKVQGR